MLFRSARENKVPVVFDPNLRFNLWNDHEELKACVRDTLMYSDIVKVSDEELEYLMENDNLTEAALTMREEYNIGILLVTCGKEGCVAYTDQGIIQHEGFKVDKPVDTTAAGDSFTGGFLSQLVSINKEYTECSLDEIKECIKVGNAVGSITVTRRGAISALPTKDEVEVFLNI